MEKRVNRQNTREVCPWNSPKIAQASTNEPQEEAVAVLWDPLEDESELVREHAAWALHRPGGVAADQKGATVSGD